MSPTVQRMLSVVCWQRLGCWKLLVLAIATVAVGTAPAPASPLEMKTKAEEIYNSKDEYISKRAMAAAFVADYHLKKLRDLLEEKEGDNINAGKESGQCDVWLEKADDLAKKMKGMPGLDEDAKAVLEQIAEIKKANNESLKDDEARRVAKLFAQFSPVIEDLQRQTDKKIEDALKSAGGAGGGVGDLRQRVEALEALLRPQPVVIDCMPAQRGHRIFRR